MSYQQNEPNEGNGAFDNGAFQVNKPGAAPYSQPADSASAQSGANQYAQPNPNPYQDGGAYYQQPYGQPPYGQPGRPQSPYTAQPNVTPPRPASDTKAVAALVCGICAILMFFIPVLGLVLGIVAIILALVSRKTFGKSGLAIAGLVTGIIGTIFSVLFTILLGWLAFTIANDYNPSPFIEELEEEYGHDFGHHNLQFGGGAVDGTFDNEDDQAAYDAAVKVLDSMANPTDEAKANLATSINDGFKASSQMDFSDIGIDPASIVDWMTTGVSYEITSVSTSDDGTGRVYYISHVRDVDDLVDDFAEKLRAFRLSSGAQGISDDQMKQRVGQIMDEAMAENNDLEDTRCSLDVQEFDGKWALTSESFDRVANDFYDTYWY